MTDHNQALKEIYFKISSRGFYDKNDLIDIALLQWIRETIFRIATNTRERLRPMDSSFTRGLEQSFFAFVAVLIVATIGLTLLGAWLWQHIHISIHWMR